MTRLLEIRVRGLRTLADVSLTFGGLTVLIGDNGTGKSTLLEVLRIVSLIPSGKLIEELHRSHAIASAIRLDCGGVSVDVRFEHGTTEYIYAIELSPDAQSIRGEALIRMPPGSRSIRDGAKLKLDETEVLFRRVGTRIEQHEQLGFPSARIEPHLILLSHVIAYPGASEVCVAAVRLFEGIDNHLPFDVTPVWGKRQRGSEKAPLREPRLAEPGHRLVLLGDNLVNVYQTLRNDKGKAHWQDTHDILRLGIGEDFEDVTVSATGGGYTTLAVELRSIGLVPALQLADGVLSYLAFVAMFRLDDGRSLLAFDEPETHLHPALLARVMTLFDEAASQYSVILATHSDRLLDALVDPVASVVVCDLDPQHETRLCRLDSSQFEQWRGDYLGVGDIRAQSQLDSILAESAE